jgi:hypothetical protein
MTANLNPDLTNWLNTATHGLPENVAELVRSEIEAHYCDALAEHQAFGFPLLEAHRAAMAELGDVKTTAQGFRDAYLSERRYLKAAFLSIAPTIVFLVVVLIYFRAGGVQAQPLTSLDFTALFGLLTFASVLYVLKSFKILLSTQFNIYGVDLPITLLKLSLFVIALSSLLSQWAFHRQVAILFNDPMIAVNNSLLDTGSALELGSRLVNIAGILVLGLGWILLGDRLLGIEDERYGLLRPLRYLFLVNGFSIVSSGIALLLGSHTGGAIAVTAVVVVGTAKCALWTLLFFRAAYDNANRPLQTA